MSKTSSVYVIRQKVLHDAWIRLLANTSFDLVGAGQSVADLRNAVIEGANPQLVIVDLGDSADDLEITVRSARGAAPEGARIVVVMSNASSEGLSASVAAGADGFLDRHLTYEALPEAFRLIMIGEKVFPGRLLADFSHRTPIRRFTPPAAPLTHKLSPRELQILSFLAMGCSNKVIAKRLDIFDTTVKVHLRSILRKIRVSNRTQAAVWAVNRGITEAGMTGMEAVSLGAVGRTEDAMHGSFA